MRKRGLGRVVLMFAVLTVLLTAGMMSLASERHRYVWDSLSEIAMSDFSENDAPYAGLVVEAKDFVWYSLEAFAVLAVSFLLVYLAGKWGVGVVLAGILWYVFGYPVHEASDSALLLPLVGGSVTGLLAYRDAVGNMPSAYMRRSR